MWLLALALASCGPESVASGQGQGEAGSGSSSNAGESVGGASVGGPSGAEETTSATLASSSGATIGSTSGASETTAGPETETVGSGSSGGAGPVCGNNKVEGDEECDGGDDCGANCLFIGTLWHRRVAQPQALDVDSDDNVLVVGFVRDDSYNDDLWIAKYTGDGDEVWAQTIAGRAGRDDVAFGVAVDAQGDALVAGYVHGTAIQPFVGLVDPDGVTVWTDTWSAGLYAFASGVAVDSEGHFVVIGRTEDPAVGGAAWVRRYTAEAELLWSSELATPQYFANGIAGGSTGTIAIVGIGDSGNVFGRFDVLDLDGQSLWHGFTHTGVPVSDQRVFDVVHTPQGYYVAVGWTTPPGEAGNRSPAIWCFDEGGFIECGQSGIALDGVGSAYGVAVSPQGSLGAVGNIEVDWGLGWLRVFDIGNENWPSLGELEFPFANTAVDIAYDSTGSAIVASNVAFWKVSGP